MPTGMAENPNCVVGQWGCDCREVGREIQTWATSQPNTQQMPHRSAAASPNFFGVIRTMPPLEAYSWRDSLRSYDRIDAMLYSYRGPSARPDTWPTFLDNWSQIGLQHERASLCQPLLGA